MTSNKRILIIGGYGGFGARLSRRLADAGHHILVAGRNLDKASAFARTMALGEPVMVDRNQGFGTALAGLKPDLVVDAAGPFQGSDYHVPSACIEARIAYVDLADGRDFVCGIGALDADANAAGVAVISGASSVPALSGAVVRKLAAGMATVSRVEMSISASNRATAGASVASSILSYVGKPVRLWQGGAWAKTYGWQDMRRIDYLLSNGSGIGNRLIALSDIPDLELFPSMLPGQPDVMFRAGTELHFQMRALWLASWLVRWNLIRSLRGAARWMLPLQRLTTHAGTDRSAMRVVVQGDGIKRVWTLIAENGDGPEIPVLAAQLLAEDLLAGRIPAGARDASRLLTLDRFEPMMAALAIRTETVEAFEIGQ